MKAHSLLYQYDFHSRTTGSYRRIYFDTSICLELLELLLCSDKSSPQS